MTFMNDLKFSIIIPTYNRAALLKRCLQSVTAQTYSNWEAIVVDNYSEDNTEEVVSSFNDCRIKYIKNHNYGIIAVSRNKAIDMATGDWICFLDSDDCWFENKLERMLDFVDDYDLIYHGYRKNIKKTKLFQRMNSYFYEIKNPPIPYVLLRGDPINPSCSCVSRKALGNIRFSEERKFVACEDYDFFLQILSRGVTWKYLREIYTLYDMAGCSHDEGIFIRDRELYKKWSDYLNDNEKKELEYMEILRKADFYRSNSKFHDALSLYLKLFGSRMLDKHIKAIKGIVLCVLRLSLH